MSKELSEHGCKHNYLRLLNIRLTERWNFLIISKLETVNIHILCFYTENMYNNILEIFSYHGINTDNFTRNTGWEVMDVVTDLVD